MKSTKQFKKLITRLYWFTVENFNVFFWKIVFSKIQRTAITTKLIILKLFTLNYRH